MARAPINVATQFINTHFKFKFLGMTLSKVTFHVKQHGRAFLSLPKT